MHDTLHYFFSTLAQSFAALAAFVFAAAQNRISWLDAKITASKMALLFKLHGGVQNIDFYMATNSATQVANAGAEKPDVTISELARDLKSQISQMQTLRATLRTHIIWGIGTVVLGLLGLVAVPLIKNSPALSWSTLVICAVLAAFSACKTGRFIYDSIKVSLKENI